MKSQPFKLTSAIVACAVLAACSSTGPKPDQPGGEVRKANTQPETLAELIDITRAGMPRRFRAERDTDLQEVLRSWTQTAGMTLQWTSAQRLSTTGGIDEIDIRAALMSLAAQFRSDQAALTLEFITPKVLRVSDVKTSELGCAMVPAGALALGRFCIAPQPPMPAKAETSALSTQPLSSAGNVKAETATGSNTPSAQSAAAPQAPDPRQAASATKPKAYAISASDETLSKALRRWCTQSGCQLIWTAEKDFPVIAAQYGTDFEDAIDRLMRDTKRSEYPLRACLYENNVLRVIHASKSCGS